jgi:hypothetical protein
VDCLGFAGDAVCRAVREKITRSSRQQNKNSGLCFEICTLPAVAAGKMPTALFFSDKPESQTGIEDPCWQESVAARSSFTRS